MERIGQLDGGEYDTLLAMIQQVQGDVDTLEPEVQQLRDDVDAIDPDTWDYAVPEGESITFQGTAPATLTNNSVSRTLTTNAGVQADFFTTDLINFLTNMQLALNKTTGGIEAVVNSVPAFKMEPGGARIPYAKYIWFDTSTGLAMYRMLVTATNIMRVEVYANNQWNSAFDISANYLKTFNDLEIVNNRCVNFLNPSGNGEASVILSDNLNLYFRVKANNAWLNSYAIRNSSGLVAFFRGIESEKNLWMFLDACLIFMGANKTERYKCFNGGDNYFYFWYKTASGAWDNAYRISPNGGVTFYKNITAPNIATTAALALAEQEITEQDLEIIEMQQQITEQDLNNIETQQLITEQELYMLEREAI